MTITNDGYLRSYRVGTTAGVGMRYLARKDARTPGILGSGATDRTYAIAACTERSIEAVKVYSPTRKNRVAYAQVMSEKLDRGPGRARAVGCRGRCQRRHLCDVLGLANPDRQVRMGEAKNASEGT